MDFVAVYAAIVGTGGLALSLYLARRDRADVKVSFRRADYHVTGPQGQIEISNLIRVEAVNRGRRPITVKSHWFELSTGRQLAWLPFALFPLPKRLEEGDPYTGFTTIRSLQDELRKMPSGCRITALVFESADGRRFQRKIGRKDAWHALLDGPQVPKPENEYLLNGSLPLPFAYFGKKSSDR